MPRDQEAESPDGASAAAQKRRKINTDSEDSSTFRRKHAKVRTNVKDKGQRFA